MILTVGIILHLSKQSIIVSLVGVFKIIGLFLILRERDMWVRVDFFGMDRRLQPMITSVEINGIEKLSISTILDPKQNAALKITTDVFWSNIL